MAQKQKIELNFSDVDEDLAIKSTGKTPKEAAELVKEQFIVLANDIMYKSKYAPLSERERKKVNIINSICDII